MLRLDTTSEFGARVDGEMPRADAVPAYLEMYRERIGGIGMSVPQFASDYSVAIRVRPLRLRGH